MSYSPSDAVSPPRRPQSSTTMLSYPQISQNTKMHQATTVQTIFSTTVMINQPTLSENRRRARPKMDPDYPYTLEFSQHWLESLSTSFYPIMGIKQMNELFMNTNKCQGNLMLLYV
jgi:hypothetical protein